MVAVIGPVVSCPVWLRELPGAFRAVCENRATGHHVSSSNMNLNFLAPHLHTLPATLNLNTFLVPPYPPTHIILATSQHITMLTIVPAARMLTGRSLIASTSRRTLCTTTARASGSFNRPGPPPLPPKEQKEFESLVKQKQSRPQPRIPPFTPHNRSTDPVSR